MSRRKLINIHPLHYFYKHNSLRRLYLKEGRLFNLYLSNKSTFEIRKYVRYSETSHQIPFIFNKLYYILPLFCLLLEPVFLKNRSIFFEKLCTYNDLVTSRSNISLINLILNILFEILLFPLRFLFSVRLIFK